MDLDIPHFRCVFLLCLTIYTVKGSLYTTDCRHPAGEPITLEDGFPTMATAEVVPVAPDVLQDSNLPSLAETLAAVVVNKTDVTVDKWAPTDTSAPGVQHTIEEIHNMYRRKRPATNMMKMVWDPEAEDLAQKWAERCMWNYSDVQERMTTRFTCGQSIARADYQMSWNATLHLWYMQGEHFKSDEQNTSGIVGDFTQLMWANSIEIGCGYKFCAHSEDESFHFYVCNYCPAGNVIPNHLRPFNPAASESETCERCGGSTSNNCENGLCANACRYENKATNCEVPDGQFPALFATGCPSIGNEPFVDKCEATCKCKDQGLLY